MKENGNEKVWKVKGISALRACFFTFFLGAFGACYVLHQFGAVSKKEFLRHLSPAAKQAVEKAEEKLKKAGVSIQSWLKSETRAELLVEHVDERFLVTTKHKVSANTLNCFLGGALRGKGATFAKCAKKNGISPAFLAAVAIHESGNGDSRAARERSNPFGIMERDGKTLVKFASIDRAVEHTAERLAHSKHYVGGGRKTIGAIQKSYCPVGARNDPKSLNRHWLKQVVFWTGEICRVEREFATSESSPTLASR